MLASSFMLSSARWAGVGVALAALSAFGQDLGLDLTNDLDTQPKLRVSLAQDNLKGAMLYVDDVEIGLLPMDPVPLSKGAHTITIQRPGYADFTSTIKADKGVVDVNAALVATGEAVHLTSEPDGCDVVVDGKGAGKTPKFLSLSPGKHELRVVRDGFADWTYTIFTRAGRDTELPAELKVAGDRPLATSLEPEQVDPDLAIRNRPKAAAGPWYTRWYVIAGAAVVVAAGITAAAVAASSPHPPNPGSVCGGACDVVWTPP
jgi:hypothetical protein